MDLPHKLRTSSGWQSGVVSRRQCIEAGYSLNTVRTNLRTGRRQLLHPGVFATYSGPIQNLTHIWGAILACGDGAVACHGTALWLAGRRKEPPFPLHIGIPDDRRIKAPRGVIVHLLHNPPISRDHPPRVPVARAVLDVCQQAKTAAATVAVVCDMVGLRETTAEALARELASRPRQRWRTLLGAMFADVAVGAQSPLELRDLRNDRAHGLPWRSRQVATRVDGRRRWQDVTITIAETGRTVVKELDGRLGHEGTGRFRDYRRDNAAAMQGRLSLRFGWWDLGSVPCEVAAAFYLVLEQLGWIGSPRRCGKHCTFETSLRELRRLYA